MGRPRRSLEQALAIFRKALPPDHPRIATSLNNLGIVQSELREYGAARQSYQQVLAILRKALPPDHPEIADSLDNLGLVQRSCGSMRRRSRAMEQGWPFAARPCPRTTPISHFPCVTSDF